MAASTDAASAVEALDRLVRVVRADADGRHQLAVRAAFVGALARSHPEVVREPGGKRAWTPAALRARRGDHGAARVQARAALRGGRGRFRRERELQKEEPGVRARRAGACAWLTYASLPPPASGESNRESNADEGQRPTTVRDATTVQAGAPAALDARASEKRCARARRSTTSNPNPRSAPFHRRKTLTPSKTPARKRPRRDAPRARRQATRFVAARAPRRALARRARLVLEPAGLRAGGVVDGCRVTRKRKLRVSHLAARRARGRARARGARHGRRGPSHADVRAALVPAHLLSVRDVVQQHVRRRRTESRTRWTTGETTERRGPSDRARCARRRARRRSRSSR